MSNMTREQIAEKLRTIVSRILEINESRVRPDSRYIDDLGADSVTTFKIISTLEEEFKDEIDYRDAEQLTTVAKTVDYIMTHMVAVPPAEDASNASANGFTVKV